MGVDSDPPWPLIGQVVTLTASDCLRLASGQELSMVSVIAAGQMIVIRKSVMNLWQKYRIPIVGERFRDI